MKKLLVLALVSWFCLFSKANEKADICVHVFSRLDASMDKLTDFSDEGLSAVSIDNYWIRDLEYSMANVDSFARRTSSEEMASIPFNLKSRLRGWEAEKEDISNFLQAFHKVDSDLGVQTEAQDGARTSNVVDMETFQIRIVRQMIEQLKGMSFEDLGFPAEIIEKLNNYGIHTVSSLLDYGFKHNSFNKIPGIDKKEDKFITEKVTAGMEQPSA